MKKLIFSLLLVFCISTSYSQWLWDFGVNAGVSNYLGDIGGKEKTRRDFVADMKLAKDVIRNRPIGGETLWMSSKF